MVCIETCANCKHRRSEKIDGWIPTCDAFPDGKPHGFNYGAITKEKECNNGIGYDEIEKKLF